MIKTEFNTGLSTIRIHDEFCKSPALDHMTRLNQIIANSYKRRTLEHDNKT